MDNFAYGIGNLIGFQLILGFMFSIYLAPSIIAVVRGHHRWPWIGFLNLASGWTVIGWIAALVWSVTAMRPASSDRADRQNYRKTTPEATPQRGRMSSISLTQAEWPPAVARDL